MRASKAAPRHEYKLCVPTGDWRKFRAVCDRLSVVPALLLQKFIREWTSARVAEGALLTKHEADLAASRPQQQDKAK